MAYTWRPAPPSCAPRRATRSCTKGRRVPMPAVPASITFPDRMVFDDGTHRVVLTRLGPAHSKGDAVAYLPEERILVSGDLCVNWKWGNNVGDRKSTRLNSSHVSISYAVFW